MFDALQRPLTSPSALVLLVDGARGLLGALHTLTPGHGKTLLAAYLVGDRGTPRQTVTLGAVITVARPGGVLLLRAVLLAGRYVVPSVVVPVLTMAADVAVLLLGVRLIRRRWHGRGSDPHHDTTTGGHVYEAHGRGQGYTAVLTRPVSVPSLATMGSSAGIVPCPEALSVLLLASGLNRTALGLRMVLASSVGLAAVLVGFGLLVTATPVLSRCSGRRFRWASERLPLLSAMVVAILGGVMTVSGLSSLIT